MDLIPIDFPLALPASIFFLKFVLVSLFIIHILLVNAMIGGAFGSVFLRMLGGEDPFWSRLARDLLDTVTVNKSMAVVLGVGPLLAINLAYTRFFYPANNITAPYWLSIIWLVALAFLSLYVYKYTWDSQRYGMGFKYFWGILGCGILALVPLIFLTNINLMLYPDQWKNVAGFLDALWLPNVLPRYLHFMNASFAITGFFVYGYFHFKGKGAGGDAAYFSRASRLGMKWALVATLLQTIFGTFNYATLPAAADSPLVLLLICAAISFAGLAVFLLLLNLYTDKRAGPYSIFVVILVVVGVMASMRHVVRENALDIPEAIALRKTTTYREKLALFMESYSPDGTSKRTGESVFREVCTACHAIDKRIVGPPMQYAIDKYRDSSDEMIEFISSPRKVDEDYPVMPKPPVTDREIEMVVGYLLGLGTESNGEE